MSEFLDDYSIDTYQKKIGVASIASFTVLAGIYLIRHKLAKSREL